MKTQKLKLGKVLNLEYGKPLPPTDRTDGGKYPVYGANGIKSRSDLSYVNYPTIIVGRKGSAGELNLTEEKFWPLDVTYFVTFDTKKYDLKFLYRLLSSLHLTKLAKGVKPGLNRNDVYDITVEIPEAIEDQRKIANDLDAADALKQKRKQAITLLDDYLKAVFLEMFGDPVTNPKGWEKEKFGNIGTLDRGISKHRPRNAQELLEGDHPLIQTGDVANAGMFIKDFHATYSDLGLSQSKKWAKGTLCITIAANIAKTGILTFDACFPDSVVGFIPNQEKTNNVFMHFWMSFFQKILEANAPESAQKNINLKILRDLNVTVPPIELQNRFSEVVRKVELMRDKMAHQSSHFEENFNALMQTIFRN